MADDRVGSSKVVQFTYFVTDSSGAQLERSDFPLSYVHGVQGPLLPVLEQALTGHAVGDVVEVTLDPERGFGPHRPELTFTDDIDNVPPQFRHVGAEVQMQNERGEAKTFVVSKIEDGKLTVDGNHPFAGKTVVFTLTVVGIREATAQEIAGGEVADGGMTSAMLH
jgi:FKBP-type peptidyl-prolyl cis-trans isomerase SlyD